jgi:hypothetical protein
MPDPDSPRRLIIPAVMLVGALLLFSLFLGPGAAPAPPFPLVVGTSPDWEVGDGLAAEMYSQNVSGTAYWEPYCESPNSTSYCVDPVGVAYIPSLNVMTVTESEAVFGMGQNAIMQFNPVTLQGAPLLPLPCSPGAPFYPGSGPDYYVPCVNATTYAPGPLLVVDAQTESIVANISLPFYVDSMTFDPINGMIYSTGSTNALATINPDTNELVNLVHVADASFSDSFPFDSYELVFDGETDQLLAPAVNESLVGINPSTGVVVSFINIGAPTVALAFDSTASQLLASTEEANSSVKVFAGETYRLEANISLPNCVDYNCAGGSANQMLIDPLHGDAYLVATGWLFTLNLSVLEVVGVVQDYGDGAQASSAYVGVADRIFGTYQQAEQVGPGFVIQLSHSTSPVVTEIMWLPTNLGTLAVASGLGAATGLVGFYIGRGRNLVQSARGSD